MNLADSFRNLCRLFRKAVQQGRSTRRGDACSVPYVEPLSTARTPLTDFVNSLLSRSLIFEGAEEIRHGKHSDDGRVGSDEQVANTLLLHQQHGIG